VNVLKKKGKEMSEVSVMSDEFHDWLDQCPVQWFRIQNGKHYNADKSYYEGASYMFLKDDEEDNNAISNNK
tara:strand:- start:363 stop:575 length:213 start_codon:yes stop_codon:yes gene_type:complete